MDRADRGEALPADRASMRQRAVVWLLLGSILLILGGGLALRLNNINGVSFAHDELYHVLAAKSLMDTGEPEVPGRGMYRRAYPVTLMTSVFFEWFGVSEASARAPFVVCNMLFVLVVFWMVRRWFGTGLALIVAGFLTVLPFELRIARECRMYAPFQLLHFVSSLLFFHALESGRAPGTPSRSRQGLLFLAAGVVAGLGFWIHRLAANLAIAVSAYCLVMACYVAVDQGWRRAVSSRYTLLLAAMVLTVVIVGLAFPSVMADFVETAREKPPEETRDPYYYYRWFFLENYPGFTFLYPLGAVLLIRQYGRRGLFVVCSFAPLMAAHITLFTARSAERYLVYILPFFLIPACHVVWTALQELWRRLAETWSAGRKVVAVALAATLVPAAGLVIHPWWEESRDLVRWGHRPNWKTMAGAFEAIAAVPVVVSTSPREMLLYAGRFPDYVLTNGFEYPEGGARTIRVGDATLEARWINEARKLEEVIERHQDIVVVVPDWAFENPAFLDSTMADVLNERLSWVEHDGDPGIYLYRKSTGDQLPSQELD